MEAIGIGEKPYNLNNGYPWNYDDPTLIDK
jgi:hypothetical protein